MKKLFDLFSCKPRAKNSVRYWRSYLDLCTGGGPAGPELPVLLMGTVLISCPLSPLSAALYWCEGFSGSYCGTGSDG